MTPLEAALLLAVFVVGFCFVFILLYYWLVIRAHRKRTKPKPPRNPPPRL